jgi:hypothetical protein
MNYRKKSEIIFRNCLHSQKCQKDMIVKNHFYWSLKTNYNCYKINGMVRYTKKQNAGTQGSSFNFSDLLIYLIEESSRQFVQGSCDDLDGSFFQILLILQVGQDNGKQTTISCPVDCFC